MRKLETNKELPPVTFFDNFYIWFDLFNREELYSTPLYFYKADFHMMYLATTEHQNDLLETISHFNLEARYDDYKKTFENKCTDEYTENQIKNIEEVRTWLKTLLLTKK